MRIALPSTLSPAALGGRDPAARIVDLAGETMGTRWTIRAAVPPHIDAAAITAVRAAAIARLDTIVAQMSHWAPQSLLSRFNRARAGTHMVLPPDFAHVVAQGLAIAQASDGAFDPAIGRVVDLWGFGPAPPATLPPDAAAIAAARAISGWHRLDYSPGDRTLRQPGGTALDLSGIAKGFAVDALADLLAAHGIHHALVEIGGELVGRGIRPDGQPWWVDLETPPGMNLAPLRIALHGLAVATSGDYVRGAHTLDPRTGYPAAGGIVAASVIHTEALAADAWATALTVAGIEAGAALATRHALAARLVTADGGEYCSPALASMLDDA